LNQNRLCLILFGPPGSGKGTQAKLLRDRLQMAHISTGDMLRERVASGDELGKAVTGIMQSGALVPDELVNKLVEDRIEQADCVQGFILDGYPRTVSQAKLLVELMALKQIPSVVVHLKVDYNVIIARLAGRRQCPTCGAVIGVSSSAPEVSEFCDRCGSTLVIRDDDRPEVVLERLKAYDRQTMPVLNFLGSVGYPMWDVDGASRSPQSIAADIVELVEKYRDDLFKQDSVKEERA
jgi:adenylate kinase